MRFLSGNAFKTQMDAISTAKVREDLRWRRLKIKYEEEHDRGKYIFNNGTGLAVGGYHFYYLLEMSCPIFRRNDGSDHRYHEVWVSV